MELLLAIKISKSSRQLRPVLKKLKRLIDLETKLTAAKIIECLEIRPRTPTDKFSDVTMWRDARIGQIFGTFNIVFHEDQSTMLLINVQFRIAATEEFTLLVLSDVFGDATQKFSKTGKGWWCSYPVASSPG